MRDRRLQACRALLALAAATAGAAPGCTYEKVVNSRPFFAGLPGSTGPDSVGQAQPADPMSRASSAEIQDDGSVVLTPGSIRGLMGMAVQLLQAQGPLVDHLMADERVHAYYTLPSEPEMARSALSRRLFMEHVLAPRTAAGYDPAQPIETSEAYDTIQAELPDILDLFANLPTGERSGRIDKIDRNLFRVSVIGRMRAELKWRSFDVEFHDGGWRLVAFGQ